jgi:hypothetical protein
MFKFFRGFRFQLASDNRFLKYSKYAMGEIVLVVIGILIALQVNNWNQDRIAKKEAEIFLDRLNQDLLSERLVLNERIKYYGKVRQHAKKVVNILSKNPDSLDSQFLISVYQASQQWIYRNLRDTYDELISTGNVNLIPNKDLRKRIGLYYNETNVYMRVWYKETDYRDLVRSHIPYDVQEKIGQACEIWTEIDKEISKNVIIDDCEPNLTVEEIERSLVLLNQNNLLQNNILLLAANRQITDINLKIGLFKRKLDGNEELLKLIEGSNPQLN